MEENNSQDNDWSFADVCCLSSRWMNIIAEEGMDGAIALAGTIQIGPRIGMHR